MEQKEFIVSIINTLIKQWKTFVQFHKFIDESNRHVHEITIRLLRYESFKSYNKTRWMKSILTKEWNEMIDWFCFEKTMKNKLLTEK